MIFTGQYMCKEQHEQTKPHLMNIRIYNQTTTYSNSQHPHQSHFSFKETYRYFCLLQT
jgi:hypothetical protein